MTTYNNQHPNQYNQHYVSSTSNQQPIQVINTNNVNVPVNAATNYQIHGGVSNQSRRISGGQSIVNRQKVLKSQQKFEQKEVMTESVRPHYDQKFSNKKNKDEYVPPRPTSQKKEQSTCCSPLILGIIGFLALAAIITTILLLTLNKNKDNNNLVTVPQNEENENQLINVEVQQAKKLESVLENDVSMAIKDVQITEKDEQIQVIQKRDLKLLEEQTQQIDKVAKRDISNAIDNILKKQKIDIENKGIVDIINEQEEGKNDLKTAPPKQQQDEKKEQVKDAIKDVIKQQKQLKNRINNDADIAVDKVRKDLQKVVKDAQKDVVKQQKQLKNRINKDADIAADKVRKDIEEQKKVLQKVDEEQVKDALKDVVKQQQQLKDRINKDADIAVDKVKKDIREQVIDLQKIDQKQIQETLKDVVKQQQQLKDRINNDAKIAFDKVRQDKNQQIEQVKKYNDINAIKLSNTIQDSIKTAFKKVAAEGQVIKVTVPE